MLPTLSQLATRLILPLGLSLALLTLGAVLLAADRRRSSGVALLLGLVWLWLCSTPIASSRLVAVVERVHPAAPVNEPAGAIVVLGGGLGAKAPPRPASDLGGEADRLLHAARLYRDGAAPLVVVTGGVNSPSYLGVSEAERMAELLEEWGVPRSALLLENDSRNTYENCIGVREQLDERSVVDVLLVTSALHMRRALATCRSAGIQARPAPTDFLVTDAPASLLDWLPDSSALNATSRAIKEIVGYEIYRVRGWIGSEPSY